MKILVTGGTGFVGQALIEKLVLGGHTVRVMTRNEKRAKKTFPYPAEFFEWDCAKEVVPSDAFSEVDAVVHLLGESVAASRWTKEQKKKIYDSRIFGTQNLVVGLAQTPNHQVKTFVSTSAIGIYGDQKNSVLTENAKPGSDFLAKVCQDWEAEVLSAKSLTDVRKVIIRVGLVLGTSGGAFAKMAPIFYRGAGGVLGGGQQWMSWVSLKDLVNLYCESLTKESYSGVYNGVSPNPVTNKEFTQTLSKVLKKPAILPAPKFGLKLALGEQAQILLFSQRAVPEEALKAGFQFQYPHLKAALEAIAPGGAHLLETAQWVPKPIDEVFEFFSSEKNLEKITPPWLNFKVLKKSTDQIQKGTLIDYKLKIKGVPISWRSEISEWEPPSYFVDQQLKGPYKKWHHRHDFTSVQGGTLLQDKVAYQVPVGALGEIFAGSMIQKDVRTIFDYRKKIIQKKFGSP